MRDTGLVFLNHLVFLEKLSPAQRATIIELCDETQDDVENIITNLGYLSEETLIAILADHLALPRITLADMPTELVTIAGMNTDFLRRSRCALLTVTPTETAVVLTTPLNEALCDALRFACPGGLTLSLATRSDLDHLWDRIYAQGQQAGTPDSPSGDPLDDQTARILDRISDAPVIRLVDSIIAEAVDLAASDIHLEPMADDVRVRYRIDGVLFEKRRLPAGLGPALASRIKVLAKLNIAERRLPQDGQIKTAVRGEDVDIRVATTPTITGEALVLRILTKSGGIAPLESLGFSPDHLVALHGLLGQSNGILLVTGPTGSGKTTSLYACLAILNRTERKIITIEDPVEHPLAGINQIQIKPEIGLSFAHCLRSVLRQDPDILMVGEIRDLETAQIAIQAALTGHLILSTVHTNSATATITRMIDMGVPDYLLAATLRGVVAQRLVRCLCPDCKRARVPTEAEQAQFFPDAPCRQVYEPAGCPACNHTGYAGRTTIAEILVIDAAATGWIGRTGAGASAGIGAGISTGISAGTEADHADRFKPIRTHALEKVRSGETSLAEIFSVID